MASFNGDIPTPSNGFNAKVEYSYTQSIENNRSTITSIVGSVKRNNASYYPYNTTKSATIKIEYLNNNGNWVTATTLSDSSAYNFNTNSYITFVSGKNINIPHKTDGTQQIRITFSVDGKLQNWYPIGTVSKTITLTKIPRYADITSFSAISSINSISMSYSVAQATDSEQYRLNGGSWIICPSDKLILGLSPNTTYSLQIRVKRLDSQQWTESKTISVSTYDYAKITDAPNITIGNNATVNYTNPYKASIQIGIFTTDGTESIAAYRNANSSSTNYTFNFTQDEINKMYQKAIKNSVTLRYYLRTYCNGSYYYSYVDRTFSVNTGTNSPIFSNFDYEDVNSKTLTLTGDNLKIIKKYSDLKVTISTNNKMIAQNGAEPSNYRVIAGDSSFPLDYSSSQNVSGIISYVNSNSVTVYAIDSRGNQTEKSKSLNVVPYTEIAIQHLNIQRENGVGENLEISLKGTYSTVDFGKISNNIKKISIAFREKYRPLSDWVDITNRFSISEGNILAENIILQEPILKLGTEYDVTIRIQDELCDIQETEKVSDGTVLWSAVKTMGVNFGGLYDPDEGGALQVEGKKVVPLDKVEIINGPIFNTNVVFNSLIKKFDIYGIRITDVCPTNGNVKNVDVPYGTFIGTIIGCNYMLYTNTTVNVIPKDIEIKYFKNTNTLEIKNQSSENNGFRIALILYFTETED